jgi:hypothetical protein
MTSTEDADTTAAGVIDHPAGGQDSDDHDRSDHPAVARVLEVLAAFGMTTTVRHLPDAVRTAKAAADALAITPAEIANSLVFAADAGDGSPVTPLLVLASGGRQVDLRRCGAGPGSRSAGSRPWATSRRCGPSST